MQQTGRLHCKLCALQAAAGLQTSQHTFPIPLALRGWQRCPLRTGELRPSRAALGLLRPAAQGCVKAWETTTAATKVG